MERPSVFFVTRCREYKKRKLVTKIGKGACDSSFYSSRSQTERSFEKEEMFAAVRRLGLLL